MQNLVKTNVSSKSSFAVNPARTKPRILDSFAESNTGIATTVDLLRNVCKTVPFAMS